MSFQTTISPTRRSAARFILRVRRALQQAYVEEYRKRGLTQSDIARELKVHRSVINRELRGEQDITLGRVAELAHVLGRKPSFSLPEKTAREGSNIGQQAATAWSAPSPAPSVLLPTPSTADGTQGKVEFLM